jgi:hypothetical protein
MRDLSAMDPTTDPPATTSGAGRPIEDVSLDASKPTALRLWGFLTLAAAGLLLGLGSIASWAVVGFTGDTQHVLDQATRGTDVWEGKVTLACGLIVLIGMLAIRVMGSDRTRKAISWVIVAAGAIAIAIAVYDLARLSDRFAGGNAVLNDLANRISAATGRSVDSVLRALQANQARYVSVSAEPGLWLVIAGGVLAILGGILSLAWANQARAARTSASQLG